MGRQTLSLEDFAKKQGLKVPEKESSNKSFKITEEKKIRYADKNPIKRSTNLSKTTQRYPIKSNNNFKGKVPTAPYNFVPLNDIVIHPPLYQYVKNDLNKIQSIQNGYKQFLQEKGKYSGFFVVNIENITPLFIGGENKKFFSIGNKYCIPGSSLRGCLKNIFKIITNSAVRVKSDENSEADVTDKILYFRNLAGKGVDPTKKLYSDRFTHDITYKDKNGILKTKKESIARAGFLVKENKKYFICRAELQVKKGSTWEVTPNKKGSIAWGKDFADIFTGDMRNKKHFYRIKSPVWKDKYLIPDNVLKGYRDDKNRKGLNLLDIKDAKKGTDKLSMLHGAENFDYIVPCFFVEKNGIVEHFGAGPYYRLPYRNSIGEHIPEELKTAQIDFTDAIFGNKECWQSRITFEDCYLQGDKSALEKEGCSKILMGPNPTSFQFYLNPDEKGNPSHWDGNTNIRGYKFYWHKNTNWRAKEKNTNDKVNNVITPVKAYNHFKGKIRFENLDAVELGALAYVFGLAEENNICYKIGMGKPIGMGSIKVMSKLYLRDDNYYKQLFATNNSGFAENLTETDKNKFITQFNEYIKNQLPEKSWNLYQKRLQQLKEILSIAYMQGKNKDEWNNKLTRYMEIGNKNDRNIVTARTPLPTIDEVIRALK